MPSTYTLISSNVLGSNSASVTFSSIPATFTDLVIRASVRTSEGGRRGNILIQLNSDSATNYSSTWILGYSSTPSSARQSNSTSLFGNEDNTNGNTTTSNTFGSFELYLPNYLASQNKPMSAIGIIENNSDIDGQYGIFPIAGLWRNTAAVTSITLFNTSTFEFSSGSSFYLYGIKNS
jgi:hypothetical protein